MFIRLWMGSLLRILWAIFQESPKKTVGLFPHLNQIFLGYQTTNINRDFFPNTYNMSTKIEKPTRNFRKHNNTSRFYHEKNYKERNAPEFENFTRRNDVADLTRNWKLSGTYHIFNNLKNSKLEERKIDTILHQRF